MSMFRSVVATPGGIMDELPSAKGIPRAEPDRLADEEYDRV